MRPSAFLSLTALSFVTLAPPSALAFCRTRTCDLTDPLQVCPQDNRGCIIEGMPLFWPEKCLSFAVQQDGSPRRGISFEAASAVIQQAYRQWFSVDCGGGERPSFRVWDLGDRFGGVICDEPEFNENEPNANVWMFRDEEWPYQGQGSTLALTTITFEVPTGEILDADVEVNSLGVDLTISETNVGSDLLSIATHEAGHFLGLAHTDVPAATMHADYAPGDKSFRTLHDDDKRGICDVYPPDRDARECTAPRPRHGYSRFCAVPASPEGCTVAPNSPEGPGQAPAIALAAAAGLVGVRLRRRRRRAER